jgi:hypothetical protein
MNHGSRSHLSRLHAHAFRMAVLLIVTLVAFGSTVTDVIHQAPVAHAAPLSSCHTYDAYNGASGYWDAEYVSEGVTSCGGSAPKGRGLIYACSGVSVTANMDAWLTQSTVHGSTRLAESGRTGNETWAPDCLWHIQVTVVGWGQVFTTPLWACLWTHDVTVNLTFDYLCAQDY